MGGRESYPYPGAYQDRVKAAVEAAFGLARWQIQEAERMHNYLGTLLTQGRSGSRRSSQKSARWALRQARQNLCKRFNFPSKHIVTANELRGSYHTLTMATFSTNSSKKLQGVVGDKWFRVLHKNDNNFSLVTYEGGSLTDAVKAYNDLG